MAPPSNLFRTLIAFTILVIIYLGHWQYSSPSASIAASKQILNKPDFTINELISVASDNRTSNTNVVVIAKRQSEDISWIYSTFPLWDKKIYSMDVSIPGTEGLPSSRGGLATAYLTYIIDHYTTLPSTLIFLNGQNLAALLSTLNLSHVKEQGYVNLRCTHDPGCPVDLGIDLMRLHESPSKEEGGGRVRSKVAEVLVENWSWIFGEGRSSRIVDGVERIPNMLGGTSGNLFAVTRDRVLARSLGEYVGMREWLTVNCKDPNIFNIPAQCIARKTYIDDDLAAKAYEHLWQVIFLRQSVFCPAEEKCYCDLYGQC